jgi:hypothetical protein
MERTFGTNGEEEKSLQGVGGKHEAKLPLGRLCARVKIKLIYRSRIGGRGLD